MATTQTIKDPSVSPKGTSGAAVPLPVAVPLTPGEERIAAVLDAVLAELKALRLGMINAGTCK